MWGCPFGYRSDGGCPADAAVVMAKAMKGGAVDAVVALPDVGFVFLRHTAAPAFVTSSPRELGDVMVTLSMDSPPPQN